MSRTLSLVVGAGLLGALACSPVARASCPELPPLSPEVPGDARLEDPLQQGWLLSGELRSPGERVEATGCLGDPGDLLSLWSPPVGTGARIGSAQQAAALEAMRSDTPGAVGAARRGLYGRRVDRATRSAVPGELWERGPESVALLETRSPDPRASARPRAEARASAPSTTIEPADRDLLAFSTIYGAYIGAGIGWIASEPEDRLISVGLGGSVGGGVGASTALLLGNSPGLSRSAEALLFTASGHGVWYGTQLGRALIPQGDPAREERLYAAGVAGSALGLGAAVVFAERAAPPPQQLRFSLASGVGWLAASGASDLAQITDTQLQGLIDIGGAATFGGISLLGGGGAPPSWTSTSLAVGHGAWLGLWSPLLFSDRPSTRQITGGMRLGLAAGYGGAWLIESFGEPSPRSAALQAMGWATGSALGAGIPLSLDQQGSAVEVVGPMLAAGVGGQALGALLAPRIVLTESDSVLLGTLGAWTTYQAIGWGVYSAVEQETPRRPVGYALTIGGTGSLVALGLAPLLDVEPSGSIALLSAGGWGTWYGAWLSQVSGLSAEQTWLTTLSSGNGALLASGLAQAAGWRPSWSDVATINGVGLVGAASGGLVGVIALYDPDDLEPVLSSVAVGSAVGLGAGALLSALEPGTRAAGGRPVGLRGLGAWRPQVSLSPLRGDDGQLGGYVRLDLTEAGGPRP